MAKSLLTAIIFLNVRSSYAFRLLSLEYPRKIQTKLHCASPDELSAVKLKITAVEYCLANFGEIVIPETEERNAVKNFSEDRLMKQLEQLQAYELQQLQAVYLELEKQKTISMSSKSTTGKLGSPSL